MGMKYETNVLKVSLRIEIDKLGNTSKRREGKKEQRGNKGESRGKRKKEKEKHRYKE